MPVRFTNVVRADAIVIVDWYQRPRPAPFPAQVADISDAVIYLASDLSRAVTATQLTVDMGATKV